MRVLLADSYCFLVCQMGVISDPITEVTPIGVDFFEIQEMGPQYSPYGVLYPLTFPQGKGVSRCVEESVMKENK